MVLAERLAAQLLSGTPAATPVAVAERLLAVQAQDPLGMRLAVRARTRDVTAGDVDRALDAGELVVAWLNRGTLHLVAREDHGWLLGLTAPQQERGVLRRLAQEGVADPARAVGTVVRTLGSDGPSTRAELGARLDLTGQALAHVLCLACLRGVAVRGPVRDGEQAYVRVETPAAVERGLALTELARRYLRGHGPATERDLARWAGVPLRDARAGIAGLGAALHQRADGLVALGTADAPGLPPPRLLGPYEPVLLGWTAREPILAAGDRRVVSGGLFRAFALVEGRAVATWRLRGAEVSLSPFARLDASVQTALRADADAVVRFLGR